MREKIEFHQFLPGTNTHTRAREAHFIILFFSFFVIYLPSPNLQLTPPPGTYNANTRGSDACKGEEQSLDQNTRQIHKGGPPGMCGQHNVKASAGVHTGQNTDTGLHTIPGQKLKFLAPPGIESDP